MICWRRWRRPSRPLEMGPAAVELIGSMILRQARSNLEYSRLMDFIEGDPEAVIVVETTGGYGG